jgi:hypothetical protein
MQHVVAMKGDGPAKLGDKVRVAILDCVEGMRR